MDLTAKYNFDGQETTEYINVDSVIATETPQ